MNQHHMHEVPGTNPDRNFFRKDVEHVHEKIWVDGEAAGGWGWGAQLGDVYDEKIWVDGEAAGGWGWGAQLGDVYDVTQPTNLNDLENPSYTSTSKWDLEKFSKPTNPAKSTLDFLMGIYMHLSQKVRSDPCCQSTGVIEMVEEYELGFTWLVVILHLLAHAL
ncbi:hypothetical protein WA026_011870 [Henosepilachna vigintioctopunctata]|uniref:Uncharacterized protein n=1 Tax=Henosepilachna vigintioctopunctata TaxID=420089 RepID=A0AAW1UIX2_9CUCU